MSACDNPNIKHDTNILILLDRGRLITLLYGDRKWHGVYWGRDETGQIVATNMDGSWRLVNVDLLSYSDRLEFGDVLSRSEIREIDAALSAGRDKDDS